MEMEIVSKSLPETRSASRQFLNYLKKERPQIHVVGLRGNLGSGKTAFVKSLAKELGVRETVTSPTFVILKNYETTDSDFQVMTHIDAYRLDDARELKALDLEGRLGDPRNLILIEWAERVPDVFDKSPCFIDFDFIDPGSRKISW